MAPQLVFESFGKLLEPRRLRPVRLGILRLEKFDEVQHLVHLRIRQRLNATQQALSQDVVHVVCLYLRGRHRTRAGHPLFLAWPPDVCYYVPTLFEIRSIAP